MTETYEMNYDFIKHAEQAESVLISLISAYRAFGVKAEVKMYSGDDVKFCGDKVYRIIVTILDTEKTYSVKKIVDIAEVNASCYYALNQPVRAAVFEQMAAEKVPKGLTNHERPRR